MDDVIQHLDHLREVHQEHKEIETRLAQVQFLRMQLIRTILSAGVSEYHVAAQLDSTPDEVRQWAWQST